VIQTSACQDALAASVPPRKVHLVRYAGVLAGRESRDDRRVGFLRQFAHDRSSGPRAAICGQLFDAETGEPLRGTAADLSDAITGL